jgi:hypothetical protein
MRTAMWYLQRATECLEDAIAVFGQPDRALWLTKIGRRWLGVARQIVQPADTPPASGRLPADRIYQCRLPLAEIAGSPLGDLLARWEEQHVARGALPARRQLEVLSIEPLLGRINLIAVQRDPLRFVWRLHGRNSVLVHGIDRTGKDTTTLRPAYYRVLVEWHYAACAICGEPTLHEIQGSFDGIEAIQYYRRLLLPLAEDGQAVDTLLSAWDTDVRTRIAFTDGLER